MIFAPSHTNLRPPRGGHETRQFGACRPLPILFVLLLASSCTWQSTYLLAAPQVVRFRNQIIEQQGIQIAIGNGFGQRELLGADAENGAVLKTDPDLESVLETAQRMRNDKNYRVASQLWQAVLRRSGDALYSPDGETYFSLVQQVENILAQLPPEGLSAYRVLADADAKEILAAAAPGDISALNKVVRQYFISSLGDDAAFQLGCVYLDQYDFVGARRMFEKIISQHPDPSVPLTEVHARIAVCAAFLGDSEATESSLELAGENSKTSLVRASLGKLMKNERSEGVSDQWQMRLGDSRRYGAMRSVDDEMLHGDLQAAWQFYYEPREAYNRAADVSGFMLTGEKAAGESVASSVTSYETKMIDRWQSKGWRPAGHLMFDGELVYFKTGSDLSVWDRTEIEKAMKFDTAETKFDASLAWRSVWRNAFVVDDATANSKNIRTAFGGRRTGSDIDDGSSKPSLSGDVQLFGDAIYQQMSVCDGIAYSIEGSSFDDFNQGVRRNIGRQMNPSTRRTRTNQLTAYDAETGVLLWTLPPISSELAKQPQPDAEIPGADEGEPEWVVGGFMAAPVAYGEWILVPVNQGGAISIYALDPQQAGKTVWKSFLCDEPESGAEPWAPINLTLEGSDLFVNCGMGVVFVLDPATGMVRFAKRYQRAGAANLLQRMGNYPGANRREFDGWDCDMVIPYGGQMICFSSDGDAIEAFNRTSGKREWKTNITPLEFKLEYVIGIYQDKLYAAGPRTVVAFDLKKDGYMFWGGNDLFDGKLSNGRGMVTPAGVFVPVEDSIYRFDLLGNQGEAKVISKVQVDLGNGAPVGNLYSDGHQFWVHGANRLYVLGAKSASE